MKNEDISLIVVGEKIGHIDKENSRNQKLKHEFALYIDQHLKIERDALPSKVKTKIECKICKKVVVSKHFKQHERVHSEEKRYKCSKCEKGFKLPHDLKRHNRIHTGERPFECENVRKDLE